MRQSTIDHLAVGWINGGNASTTFENDSESTLDAAPTLCRITFLSWFGVSIQNHVVVNERDCEDVGLACVEGFREAFNEDGG
ncbi:MAG: Uncharacterised protein [Candidatus Poseidoniaceae archaeon]|nr:MAG: Uncharacterised protein [Candidatus Poseidoniaceae archaeon]